VPPLGIFGGTFDPIHFGHLRAAFELAEVLALEQVLFVPAADPPHRAAPLAGAAQRFAMVRAAIEGEPRFVADDRELRRAGPSYTVLTLEELRAEQGTRPLVLLLGLDAFEGLATWHRWEELLTLAHIAVARRPGAALPSSGALAALLEQRGVADPRRLQASPAGCLFVHPGTQLDISSTEVRTALGAGRDPRYLMPEAVRRMILDTGNYARPGEAEG
jgi:nicotinate-nucleotide adenylyltransferase